MLRAQLARPANRRHKTCRAAKSGYYQRPRLACAEYARAAALGHGLSYKNVSTVILGCEQQEGNNYLIELSTEQRR